MTHYKRSKHTGGGGTAKHFLISQTVVPGSCHQTEGQKGRSSLALFHWLSVVCFCYKGGMFLVALISNVCIPTLGVYCTQSRYRYRIQMTWNLFKAVGSQDAHSLGEKGSRKMTWS